MGKLISLLPFILATAALMAVIPGLASDYTLKTFGNANMDNAIDENDVAYVEGIIKRMPLQISAMPTMTAGQISRTSTRSRR